MKEYRKKYLINSREKLKISLEATYDFVYFYFVESFINFQVKGNHSKFLVGKVFTETPNFFTFKPFEYGRRKLQFFLRKTLR